MSRKKPLPMKISRQQYEYLVARANRLRTLGPDAERIIEEFLDSDIAKTSIKDLNAHQLEQQVMKYANRLFHAEKRIIREAHSDEWRHDDHLKCIGAAIRLQEASTTRNYNIRLRPGYFTALLGSLEIDVEYMDEQILDFTRIIKLWSQSEQ